MKEHARNVLIIAPLDPSIGSFRPIPLAKYLPEFGWRPVIVTPGTIVKPDIDARIIETPYRDALAFYRKLFRTGKNESIRNSIKRQLGAKSRKSPADAVVNFGSEFLTYPDSQKGWQPYAYEAADALLQRERFDAMISCFPVSAFIVASRLKAKYRIPWLADYTDLWSQNCCNYNYTALRKFRDRRLERKTLSGADALVTVSGPLAEKLEELHGVHIHSIPNGFEPTELNKPPAELTAKFTITYTGSIYGKVEPAKLFQALAELNSEGSLPITDIEVRFYGQIEDWVQKDIEQYKLQALARQNGVVPRNEAVKKQRESQVLFFLNWEDPREKGLYSGKIFEYLAARRPVLATGGFKDVVSELLSETNAGIDASSMSDIKKALVGMYREYKLHGRVSYAGKEEIINKYSHIEMARKFALLLDSIASVSDHRGSG